MTKIDYKERLRKLSGMTDEELKDVREASIERLQLMGFKKIDEMMIAISSAQIIDSLKKYKKDLENNLGKYIQEQFEICFNELEVQTIKELKESGNESPTTEDINRVRDEIIAREIGKKE